MIVQNPDEADSSDLQAFCSKHQIHIEMLAFDKTRNAGGQINIRHITSATFLRLHLDQLLPSNLNRFVYLDSDVFVDQDISELFECDLGTSSLAAVPDVINAVQGVNSHLQKIGMRNDEPYFNAGVLVFSWRRILTSDVLARARNMAGQKLDYHFHDQDILNILFQSDWLRLETKYNAVIHTISAGGLASIAHFVARKNRGNQFFIFDTENIGANTKKFWQERIGKHLSSQWVFLLQSLCSGSRSCGSSEESWVVS